MDTFGSGRWDWPGVSGDKIHLQQLAEQIHVPGVLNHTRDLTAESKSCAESFMQLQADLDCYIVKYKLPGCNYQSTPLSQGLFDASMLR